ncbi:MAG: fabG [Francisellaceae bacterium]|nr:fabG [Francisellaceae bacterium]
MIEKEKLALVTGASRGIGQAIALLLGQEAMTVIGSSTTQKGADNITELFKQHQIKGQGVVLNVNDAKNIEETLKFISQDYTAPNILINNAGITKDNLFLRMKELEWDEVINTNLTGIYRLIQACMRSMIKARWGRIVNISSIVGVTGNPGQANYAAAKAGLIGLTKTLALELGSRNITVNAVAPGFINTDMTRELNENQQQKLKENIPLGRIGLPEEIAYAVGFLVSHKAAYITGETIHVNGGMYMG